MTISYDLDEVVMRDRATRPTRFVNVRIGVILFFLFFQGSACSADQSLGVSFTVSTSSPHVNTYVLGEKPDIVVSAAMNSSSSAAPTIAVSIKDYEDNVIENKTISMTSSGNRWVADWVAPAERLGFYRAYITMNYMGHTIPVAASGSRPEGFITYSVVPDPASRQKLSESNAFFGMQGGFSDDTASLLPLLGVHWVLGHLDWSQYAPESPEQFLTQIRSDRNAAVTATAGRGNQIEPLAPTYKGINWPIYPLPTLEVHQPKWLSSLGWDERYAAWGVYCKRAAQYFSQVYPNLPERIYQVTWEPNYKWKFDGTLFQLVKWQQIAYDAVHSVDSHAVVIGPAGGQVSPSALKWTSDLVDLGMWKHIDGWSLHPYTKVQLDNSGRVAALENGIRSIKEIMHSASARDIDIYSTEAGYQSEPTIDSELNQAEYIVKSNVLMYALNLRLSMAFFVTDYPDRSGFGVNGFGFYYNCTPGTPFGARCVSPKPVAPAYAAMTYMLDGAKGEGEIAGTSGVKIYKFTRNRNNILVIWNTEKSARYVDVPGAGPHSRVFDWMGNPIEAVNTSGQIKVTRFPEYVEVE